MLNTDLLKKVIGKDENQIQTWGSSIGTSKLNL